MASFITHTFAECVENHDGMQTIGCKRARGFTEKQLAACAKKLDNSELHSLKHEGETASVLVIRDGVDRLLGSNGAAKLLAESTSQAFDKQFLNTRRRVVQTKHGRHNNCYADEARAPNIAAGQGTVISFRNTPHMAELRAKLPELLGNEAAGLFCETNKYTDVHSAKVGIGFHGDTERSIVVGVRLGAASQPLRFQWYHRAKAVSKEYAIDLKHGDLYAMSHKATGYDWRCSSKWTLRHGTGKKAKPRAVGI